MSRNKKNTQIVPQTCYTVVYDGECPFCTNQMKWIQQRDQAERFQFVPNQEPTLLEQYPQLENQDLNSGLRLIQPDGTVQIGADAVYGIARQLSGWRWLALLYRIPLLHGIARWLYGWIAAHRRSLAPRCDQSCPK